MPVWGFAIEVDSPNPTNVVAVLVPYSDEQNPAKVNLTWDNPTLEGWDLGLVFRGTDTDPFYSQVAEFDSSVFSATDFIGELSNATFRYYLLYYYPGGEPTGEGQSNEVTLPASPNPSNFTVTLNSTGSTFLVDWDAPTLAGFDNWSLSFANGDADTQETGSGYVVEDTAAETSINTRDGTTTDATLTYLSGSDQSGVKTLTGVPLPPADGPTLFVQDPTTGGITFSWTAPAGANTVAIQVTGQDDTSFENVLAVDEFSADAGIGTVNGEFTGPGYVARAWAVSIHGARGRYGPTTDPIETGGV